MAARYPLIAALRAELAADQDPERAAQQQAYMKSSMPHAGFTAQKLRTLGKHLIKQYPCTSAEDWFGCAQTLWDEAQVREERYIALELLAVNRYRKQWYSPACLPMYRHFIESGAWWDYVDNIASNHIGVLLKTHAVEVKPVLRAWATTEHLWLRRTAILAQLKFKSDIDLVLLDEAIQGSIHDQDFFARKAIGWALRAHSYTDPDWVISYLKRHEDSLSPLSVREALKVIKRKQASVRP